MSPANSQILDFLKRTAEGIAQTFGPSCETLIHDMSKPGHPIVAIYNSHVSGRQAGSTADIFGDDLGNGENRKSYRLEKDIVNSLAVTKNGRYIKSTTIHYMGEDYHYALGINFDYTALNSALSSLEGLVTVNTNLDEAISDSHNTQLEDIFEECLSVIGKPVEAMKKSDRLQLIALLMQKNVFRFQKSIIYVAEKLKVSRYTIYKYCHEIEESLK